MRKLILISACVLASLSAHAGESRSLILAANDEPKAVEKVEAAKPGETKAQETKAQETKAEETRADVNTESARTESSKHHAARPEKKYHVRGYEADEAKARRIAAKYGVYW